MRLTSCSSSVTCVPIESIFKSRLESVLGLASPAFKAKKCRTLPALFVAFLSRQKGSKNSSPVSLKTLAGSYHRAQKRCKNRFFAKTEQQDFSAFLAATGTSTCSAAANEIDGKPLVRFCLANPWPTVLSKRNGQGAAKLAKSPYRKRF